MKVLFWDIETAPTTAFIWKVWQEDVIPERIIEPGRMLCWTASWLGEDKVYYDAEWINGPEHMVRNLHALLDEADFVVTYNGNHFDIPVVNAAFARLGLAPPSPYKSIDLYRVVRSKFRLLYNRLDYVCEYFGLGTKLSTGGFRLWIEVMNGDKKAQAKMLEYNKQDVLLLEALYAKLLPWLPTMYSQGPGHNCPACESSFVQRRGIYRTKTQIYQRYQCTDCGAWSRSRVADKDAPKNELVSV